MSLEDLDSEDYDTKFSDYFEYKSVVGKGAFGVVVSAISKADEKEYAVKVNNHYSHILLTIIRSSKNKVYRSRTGNDSDRRLSCYLASITLI